MAQTSHSSNGVNRPDATNGSTKSPDTYRPHYYTTFQNHCCESKTNTTTTPTQNKDLLTIPKRFKTEAEVLLNLIHGVLIENLTEIAGYTSIIPNIFFESTDNTHIHRYLIDRIILKTMNDAHIINWNLSLKQLYPMRTSGNGNCLLHAVLIAMVGIHDSNLYLRDRLAQFMDENKDLLKNHWRIERLKSDKTYGIRSEDSKLNDEWDELCDLVHYERSEDGQSTTNLQFLEAVHIFSIANMLHRPIIVLAEDVIRNKNGEAISVNDLYGIYLPILSTSNECIKAPIVLAYDHSHFCPLQTNDQRAETPIDNLLPLYQSINHIYDQTLLPIRFLGDDVNADRSNGLLHEYLQVRKVKYTFDSKSTPLSIICTELGSKHLSLKNNFFLVYHKYLIDFFQVQKPALIDEERKRQKQRDFDDYVARHTTTDNSGWSLIRQDPLPAVSTPVTTPRTTTSTNTTQTRNPNNHSSEQRYIYDGSYNNEVYIPLNGGIHMEKPSTQPQQSNRPLEFTKPTPRETTGLYPQLSPTKQSQSTNHLDNINNFKSNDKFTSTLHIERQDVDSNLNRERSRIQIPVQRMPPGTSSNNQKFSTPERFSDSACVCLNCRRSFHDTQFTLYCPQCEETMHRSAAITSRPQTRSQPANMYLAGYSTMFSPALKTAPPRRVICQYCRSPNILNSASSRSGYYCSVCQNAMVSSYHQ